MIYKSQSFQGILEVMASCEQLGFLYSVEKEIVNVRRKIGFGTKSITEPLWTLTITTEGEEDNESDNL